MPRDRPEPGRLVITVTYNERTEDTEEQAERLSMEYVHGVQDALERLGHSVQLLEVSGETPDIVRRIGRIEADLVFNLAEGEEGVWREAIYPMLFEFVGLPYTGAGPATLALGLDKRLTEEVLALKGLRVPRGALVTPEDPRVPGGMEYPLLIKPNFEGSSMGIHQDSVVASPEEARARIEALLPKYPQGLDVEEFVRGREITVGYLAAKEDPLTEIVEYRFPENGHNILDYETKHAEGEGIETLCPAPLSPQERDRVRRIAARAVQAMRLPDFGRVDMRLREDGEPVLIEVNPLAGIRSVSPLAVGAKAQGCSYEEVVGLIVQSAARRHGIVGRNGST